jgi:hypothetical protein
MNPAALGSEGSASERILYMALELSNKTWQSVFGDGVKRRHGAGRLIPVEPRTSRLVGSGI